MPQPMFLQPPPPSGTAGGVASWWETIFADGSAAMSEAADVGAVIATDVGGTLEGVAVAGGASVLAGLGIGDIIIGAIAVGILVGAFDLLLYPLADIFGAIPIVGGYLKSTIQGLQARLNNGIQQLFSAIFGAIYNIAHWAWGLVFGTTSTHTGAINNTFGHMRFSVEPWVQSVADNAHTEAQNALTQADNNANSLYNREEANRVAGENAISNNLNNLYNAAIAHADANLVQADNNADDLYNRAIQHSDANLVTAENNATAQNQQTQSQLQQGLATVENDVHNLVGGVETQIQTLVLPAIAAAAAAAAGAAGIINNYLDNCGTEMCQANGQNAKNVNKLAKALEAGAFFAFIAACIEEPEPMAAATFDTAGTVIDSVAGLLTTVIGVALP